MITLNVNGTRRSVKASPDTPLLYVLRNELGVMTPKFGCGIAQCGACLVLLGDQEIRACITPNQRWRERRSPRSRALHGPLAP